MADKVTNSIFYVGLIAFIVIVIFTGIVNLPKFNFFSGILFIICILVFGYGFSVMKKIKNL